MKLFIRTAALAAVFTLAACGGANTEANNSADNGMGTELNNLEGAQETLENVADMTNSQNVSDALGNQADAVENAADALESNASNAL
jgi:hypothetical protein